MKFVESKNSCLAKLQIVSSYWLLNTNVQVI